VAGDLHLETKLRGVLGGRTAGALERGLGLITVGDLLRHYPRRYAERGELTAISALADGDHVTIVADIASVTSRRMRSKRGSLLEVLVTDGSDSLVITFFNQPWRERELRVGERGLFAGTISSYRDKRQLAHPQYVLLGDGSDDEKVESFAGAIIPVYRSSKSVTSWQIQSSVGIVLDSIAADVANNDDADPIPRALREELDLPDVGAALEGVHRPASWPEIDRARKRLVFEEALVLQASLVERRHAARAYRSSVQPTSGSKLREAFDSALPFDLTPGQQQVGAEVSSDLARDVPMQRLLQGDVGSGKTVVAVRAMLDVVAAGGQAVLLAPTEVLASQHAAGIRRLLGPLAEADSLLGSGASIEGTSLVLLTGSARSAQRRAALEAIESGTAGLIVGTHALLEESVQFSRLGLVVIDEQHRFGVEQRAALAQRAPDDTHPHVLVMTATPIPRTVAMTVFGDLDVSTLDEVPAGRAEVTTHVVNPATQPRHVDRLWERAAEEAAAGHRVFIVCPRIDAMSAEEGQAATDEGQASAAVATVEDTYHEAMNRLPNVRVAALHGRMSSEDKDAVMAGLAAGSIDVVVSTTVIEVGVDVPDATMMVVFDADRFGISQLHQLRGRIGRGRLPGVCLLVSAAEAGTPARERLDAVAATRNGFELAQRDLEIRREGDVLGGSQSGVRSSLRLLRVVEDADVISTARAAAEQLIEVDSDLSSYPALREAMTRLDEEQAEFLEKS
jgi:ATP-dependent DNA helicase RecG